MEIGTLREELDWELNLAGKIQPHGYFLIAASDRIPDFDLNYSNLGGKLNNSSQKVLLKDEQGTIIDEVNTLSGWGFGDNKTKQTMERKNPGVSGLENKNWATSFSVGGTPRYQNSALNDSQIKSSLSPTQTILPTSSAFPTQTPFLEIIKETDPPDPPIKNTNILATKEEYPAGIIINEILPSPQGQDETEEWIEIFNSGESKANLANWKITDIKGKTISYDFPDDSVLQSKGFLVISRPETKIILNNDSDGLILFYPNGDTADKIDFASAPQNQSFNRTNAGWEWSSNLTPRFQNIVSETKIILSNAQIKETGSNNKVSVNKTAAIGKTTANWNLLLIIIPSLTLAFFSGFVILSLKKKITQRS